MLWCNTTHIFAPGLAEPGGFVRRYAGCGRRVETPDAVPAATAERPAVPAPPVSGAIEVLLLDVGGVLVPFADPALSDAAERELGLDAGGLRALLYECEAWYALSTGRIDEGDYWRLIAEQARREQRALEQLLRSVWEPGPTQLDQGVLALVRAARLQVRVGILSNNTLRMEEHLHACGVDGLFDPVINSARVGLRKPDPRIFLHALEVLGVPPGAVLFVDDKARNTMVADELGMRSVCFDSADGLRSALVGYGILSADAT